MAVHGRVRVTDKDGWRQEFVLDKALVFVGSAPENDIVLPIDRGAGVAARQVQLVALGEEEPRFRVVNLGASAVRLPSGDEPLAPRAVGIVGDGDELQLGDFSLAFHLGDSASAPAPNRRSGGQKSSVPPSGAGSRGAGDIGLAFHLSRTVLETDQPIEGTITVHNSGSKPGVQFRIELLGFPADCYEMGPGPILFPGAEKRVPLRIRHPQSPDPAAGDHEILVRVSAPDAYPGQRAEEAQTVRVAPFYRHALHFVPETR
jgi:hypothetical protein